MAVLNLLTLSALTAVVFAVPTLRKPDILLQDSAHQLSLGTCVTKADCVDRDKIDLQCNNGMCQPRKLGQTCLTSFDCSTFLTCTSGTCQVGAAGSICEMWRQCALGNSCVDRTCTPGINGTSCEISYSCAEGLTCHNLMCTPGVANLPCRTDKDCDSGICRIQVEGPFASGVCTIPMPSPRPSPSASSSLSALPSPSTPIVVIAASAPASASAAPITPLNSIAPNAPADPDPAQIEVSGSPTPSVTASPSPSSPAPDTAAAGTAATPIVSPTPTPTPICIGDSSHRAGVSLRGLLRPVHRMQYHPLRMFVGTPRVLMHCFESGDGRLCASATHIVEHEGKLMYMVDFCRGRRCTLSMEVPLNFKGPCSEHIEFISGLSATQHSAQDKSQTAEYVAHMECTLRSRNRVLWTARTL